MELKPGYKQTEVGRFPESWSVKELGDFAPFITSGSRGWANYYSEFGDVFLRITNLSRSWLYPRLDDLKFVSLPKGDSEGARTQLKDGDLLISITADIGVVGYVNAKVPKPAYINQHIALVRLDPSSVNSLYISYFLASANGQALFRALADSGAKAGMNLSTVRKILTVAPPSLDEQKAIADTLSDTDDLIESLEQLLTKKRQIRQGAIQELLTGKRRLAGFSGEWIKKSLGECLLASPDYGINASAVPYSDRLPTYIRITDITEEGRFAPAPLVSVAHPCAEKYYLNEGELVFARTGASVGKSYLYKTSDGVLVFAGFLIRVRLDPSILDSVFFAYFVQTNIYWGWVKLMSMRSGQPGINSKEFSQLPLSVPSVTEQVAICSIISGIESEVVAIETKLQKTRHLKQSMMQELLTGRIRLV